MVFKTALLFKDLPFAQSPGPLRNKQALIISQHDHEIRTTSFVCDTHNDIKINRDATLLLSGALGVPE